MQTDFMLVGGVIMVVASLPALLNSYSRGQGPGAWAAMMIAGLALVTVVMTRNPGTYSVETLPDAFWRVFSDLF